MDVWFGARPVGGRDRLERGELRWVEFDPPVGRRTAVIFTTDNALRGWQENVQVIPTVDENRQIPKHPNQVELVGRRAGAQRRLADVSKLTRVDSDQVLQRVRKLTPEELFRLEAAVLDRLGFSMQVQVAHEFGGPNQHEWRV